MTYAKRIAVTLATVFLTLGTAQAQDGQNQQNQQNQQDQQQTQTQQQQTQTQPFRLDRPAGEGMTQALDELRQIHERLGQVIEVLEGQAQLGQRIERLEQAGRSEALREARRELELIRNDLAAGEEPEQSAQRIRDVRRDLSRAAADVRGDQARFDELETELVGLEEQVRAGQEDVDQAFQDVVTRFDEEIEGERQRFDRAMRQDLVTNVRTRLNRIGEDIEAGRDADRVQSELIRARENLQRAFRDADEAQRQQVDQFVNELRTLEDEVAQGGQQAFQTYQGLMDRFDETFADFTNGSAGMDGQTDGQTQQQDGQTDGQTQQQDGQTDQTNGQSN